MTQENRGKNITCLEEFIRKIGGITSESEQKYLAYRGHRNHEFKIYPSVLRKPSFREAEDSILRELIASLPDEFSSDESTLDQLARAQHYSLPTRLLDVTTNPLAALYFAVQEGNQKIKGEIKGQVIVFRVDQCKVKFFDSDTVSCIANLAHLSNSEKNSIDSSKSKGEYHRKKSIGRLLQFIRSEKPYFKNEIKITDLQTVLYVKPKMNTRRLLAQSGAFLIFGMACSLDENQIKGIEFERIEIDGKSKANILRELKHVGIHASSMFPEIETKARYIRKNLEA